MQLLNAKHMPRRQLLYGSFICTIAAFFYCYEFILRIVPGVLQTELTAVFGHISASSFGQLSALYYFAYSPMQMPVGMLMDRFGPRRLLSLACLCCTLGSLMFSYSNSLLIAGSGRFMVGFGSSFAFVGVLSLGIHWLPRRYFSLLAGLMTTLGMLGLVYGEIKITKLANSMGLAYVLSMLVIMGLVLTAIIFLIVRDAPQQIQDEKPEVKQFLFNVWRVLISPQVWLIGFIGAALYTSLSIFGELWGKGYLEKAYQLTSIQAAKTMSMLFLGWAIGAPLFGYFSDRSGNRLMPLIYGALLSLIFISIVLYYPALSYTNLNICIFLYGLFSASEIIVFIMAKENSRAQLSGTVFAATNMIVTLGGVILQPFVGFLLDLSRDHNMGADQTNVYSADNYQFAMSVIPVILLLVIICMGCFKNYLRNTRS
jgi:MFS family permease